MKLSQFFRFSISTAFLIIANIITIVFAVMEKWNATDVMFIYWAQSIIIVCFAILKVRGIKQCSLEGWVPNPQTVEADPIQFRAAKRQAAWKFLFIYSFMHIIFLITLLTEGHPSSSLVTGASALCILIFLINHGFSYWYNRKSDINRKPFIGSLVLFPSLRILPMHLTMLFGSLNAKSTGTLVLLLILKTLVDVIMHMVEHRPRREEKQTGAF